MRVASGVAWIGLDAGEANLATVEHAALALARSLGDVDEVYTHSRQGSIPYYGASLRIRSSAGAWEPEFVEDLRDLADGAVIYERGDWAIEVGDVIGRAGARAVIAAHATGTGGRAIRFLGQDQLRGDVRVDWLVAGSAIAEVQVLGTALAEDAILETRDYLRPQYVAGSLTLIVTPLDDGRVQPFELEHAHQCCDGH